MLRICAWAEHQIGRMHCFCQTNDPTSIRRHRQYAHNSFIFLKILYIFLKILFIFLQKNVHIFTNIVNISISSILYMIALKEILLTFVLTFGIFGMFFSTIVPFQYWQAFSVFSLSLTKQFSRVGLQSHL